MFRIKNLSLSYGSKSILKEIHFRLNPGEVVGLLGSNGAGKTTLMRCMTGFLPPTSGEIFFRDQLFNFSVSRVRKEILSHIGYLPENNPLYPELTPFEYLKFRAEIKQISHKIRRFEVQNSLKEFQLEEYADRKISHLSRGTRQRVGLADLFLGNPPFLFLDEPTNGLDPEQLGYFRNWIQTRSKDRVIIMSSHILPELGKICDRIILLRDGKIYLNKTLKELEEDFSHKLQIRGHLSSFLAPSVGHSRFQTQFPGIKSSFSPSGLAAELEKSDGTPFGEEELFSLHQWFSSEQIKLSHFGKSALSLETLFQRERIKEKSPQGER